MCALVSLDKCAVHLDGLDLLLQEVPHEQNNSKAFHSDDAAENQGSATWGRSI